MILPYNVDRPARLTPAVTYALIALNVLVYLLTTGYTNYKMYADRPATPADTSLDGGSPASGSQDGASENSAGASTGRSTRAKGARVAGSGYGFVARAGFGVGGERFAQGDAPPQSGGPDSEPGAPDGSQPGASDAGMERPEPEMGIAAIERLSKTPEGRSALWQMKREAWNQAHVGDALALDTHPDVMEWLGYLTVAPTLLSIFTSMFLHGSLDHLLGNMLFLWVFGRAVEDTLGRGIYLAAYILCGLAAVMLYHFISIETQPGLMIPFMGASGAIMGVTGLFAPRFYRTPVRLFYLNFHGARIFYLGTLVLGGILARSLGLGSSGFTFGALLVLAAIVIMGDEMLWAEWKIPAAWVIGIGIIIQDLAPALFQMAIGFVGGGTAHWAHIGGFLCGAIYAFLIGSHREGKTEYLVEEARQSLDLKHGNSALEAAQQVVMMKPDDPVGYQLLAEAHDRKGNTEVALDNYKLALGKYLRKSERSMASKLYQDAMLKHSEWVPEAPTLFILASQMVKDSDWKGAAESLAKLPYYYPEASEGEMAFLRAAQIYIEKLDQPIVAMQLLQEFGARFPQSQWMPKATALYEAASQGHSGVSTEAR